MEPTDKKNDLMLGVRVAAWRRARGVTQETLAAALGIDQSSLSAKEQGRRKFTVDEVLKIAEGLGVSITLLTHYRSEDPRDLAFLLRRAYRRLRQLAEVKRQGKPIGVRAARDILDLLNYVFVEPDRASIGTDLGITDPLTEEMLLLSKVEEEVQQELKQIDQRKARRRVSRPKQRV